MSSPGEASPPRTRLRWFPLWAVLIAGLLVAIAVAVDRPVPDPAAVREDVDVEVFVQAVTGRHIRSTRSSAKLVHPERTVR